MSASNRKCIIVGDINIDVTSTSNTVEKYISLLNSYNFEQTISIRTRICENTATTIDHILTNITDHFIECGCIETDVSDHFCTFAIVKNLKYVFKQNTSSVNFDFSGFNKEAFLTDLSNISWQPVYESTDPNDAYKIFYDKYFSIASKHVPNKKKSKRKCTSTHRPWLSRGLLTSIRKKHSMYSNLQKSPNNVELRRQYNLYRNVLTKLLRSAKRHYYKNKLSSVSGNTNKTWQVINEIINKNSTKGDAPRKIKLDNDELVTESSHIANIFCEYFTNIGPNLASRIHTTTNFSQYLKGNYVNSFFLRPVVEDDIANEIKGIDPKKAVGYDFIHPLLVQHAVDYISRPLAHIINLSISHGLFPDALKSARITPVFKKGSPLNGGNYRPISILPTLRKIIENLVNKQLVSFLDKYDILLETQYGFRKKRSTKLALADLVSDIADKLDDGHTTLGIFIDLKKAFDTIDHGILLRKLEHYGVRGLPLLWFKSYLQNRQQSVVLDWETSHPRQVQCGVPQGSILGPTLFLIYINDIDKSTNFFNFRLFADDTNLFKFTKSQNTNLNTINAELNLVNDWCKTNKLTINVEKTNYMIIKTPQRRVTIDGHLSIGGAGVGKSVVVRMQYQALHRYLCSSEGQNPEDCRTLLCAPTGKAAYNINGCKNNFAFQIPANQGFDYKPLDSDKLISITVKYRNLSVVIMDEVSMVGHLRFQELIGNKKLFGGISILVIGDLFQLKPVIDGWIFQDLVCNYGLLATNLW
ncbi:uncharacterized protein LOC144445410 [Glandiceps talaboti]